MLWNWGPGEIGGVGGIGYLAMMPGQRYLLLGYDVWATGGRPQACHYQTEPANSFVSERIESPQHVALHVAQPPSALIRECYGQQDANTSPDHSRGRL